MQLEPSTLVPTLTGSANRPSHPLNLAVCVTVFPSHLFPPFLRFDSFLLLGKLSSAPPDFLRNVGKSAVAPPIKRRPGAARRPSSSYSTSSPSSASSGKTTPASKKKQQQKQQQRALTSPRAATGDGAASAAEVRRIECAPVWRKRNRSRFPIPPLACAAFSPRPLSFFLPAPYSFLFFPRSTLHPPRSLHQNAGE